MTRRYTYATCLGWGGDEPTAEIDVTLSYAVDWGSPGTGRPYFGPPENYDEGSPPEVQDLCVEKIDGRPVEAVPGLLVPILEKIEDIEADLFPHLIYHALEVDAERQRHETHDAF